MNLLKAGMAIHKIALALNDDSFNAVKPYLKEIEDEILDEKIIKVKYTKDIIPIEITQNGDWIDLRCAEDVTIYKDEYKAIPLGVAIQLPAGYEAIVAPRSSLYKNYGLICVNSIGIIDESYCGDNDEWHFLVRGTLDRPAVIPKNTRICQFRIIEHQPSISFETVETLGNKDRNGIGSTGKI